MTASLSATDAIEQGADQLSKGTASSPPLLQPSLTLGLFEVSCFSPRWGRRKQASKKNSNPEHWNIWPRGFCCCVLGPPDQISESHSHRESWEAQPGDIREGGQRRRLQGQPQEQILIDEGCRGCCPDLYAQNICCPSRGQENRQGQSW